MLSKPQIYCSAVFLACSSAVLLGDQITFGENGNQFSIEFVEIGSPGNADDPRVTLGKPDAPSTTFMKWPAGSVDYVYAISKFEIPVRVANLASELGSLEIAPNRGYDEIAIGFGVEVSAREESPALIHWGAAARFVNWLNESKGYPHAYRFSSQVGDRFYSVDRDNSLWNEGEVGYNADNLFRNRFARYVLPSIDEWHKAAYYDPDKDQGAGGYWLYTTGSDEEPVAVVSGVDSGTSVYNLDPSIGPADVDKAGGLSPFGVMGMGGNAHEWTENHWNGENVDDTGLRDSRGGRWDRPTARADRNQMSSLGVSSYRDGIGFRVVDLGPPDPLLGDLDGDWILTEEDIDLLSERVIAGTSDLKFDLNDDGAVTASDRTFWVEQIANTNFGDSNLDGTVDFGDFLALSASFDQDDGWAGGDFDGSGMTNFADFAILSANFGASRRATASIIVPEPRAVMYLLGVLASVCFGHGKTRARGI